MARTAPPPLKAPPLPPSDTRWADRTPRGRLPLIVAGWLACFATGAFIAWAVGEYPPPPPPPPPMMIERAR